MKIKPFLKIPIDTEAAFKNGFLDPNFGSPLPVRRRRPRNGRFQGNMKKASIKAGYLRSHRVAPTKTKNPVRLRVVMGDSRKAA